MPVYKPRLGVDLPSGWFAKESFTMLEPEGRANIIASTEPLNPAISVEEYVQAQGDVLHSEFPEFQELDFGPSRVFGGRPGFMRRFQWRSERGVVSQIQIYHVDRGTGYTATATVPSEDLQHYEPLLLEALAGLRIDG